MTRTTPLRWWLDSECNRRHRSKCGQDRVGTYEWISEPAIQLAVGEAPIRVDVLEQDGLADRTCTATDYELQTNVRIPGKAKQNPTVLTIVDNSVSGPGESIVLKLTSARPTLTIKDTDEVMGGSGLRGRRKTVW